MVKRTAKQIEKDLKKVKEAAKTASTFKELGEKAGLTVSMVKTTLVGHPNVYKKIKEQLEENKLNSSNVNATKSYVIDASITGAETFKEEFSAMYKSNSNIILTSITINELEKMQKYNDQQGYYARKILNIAAEENEKFLNVLIDDSFETADDCIINYCSKNKDNVILISSDKTMVLKARMYEVEAEFLKQYQEKEKSTMDKEENKDKTLVSLMPAKKIGGKLFVSNTEEKNFFLRTYSNGIEFRNTIKELKAGDDVFLATDKEEYLSFAHYKMVNDNIENNAELVYNTRIYNKEELENLDKKYKSFVKDFVYILKKVS